VSNPINFEKDSEMLKALGHPVRLKILYGLISVDECNVNKIVENLNTPQSTISQHLGILKSRGIISPKKDGVKTCYTIADKRVLKIFKILKE
jgi:DNA-binding transcriptional ArsR family regulator